MIASDNVSPPLSLIPYTSQATTPTRYTGMSHDDEDYFLPLEDQRVFGAGIRRKRVPFVRSSEHELNTTSTNTSTTSTGPGTGPGPSIADKYLSIVLPKGGEEKPDPSTAEESAAERDREQEQGPVCEICNFPLPAPAPTPTNNADTNADPDLTLRKKHDASLAHQLCLAHSHPPSHFDRTRHGLRYLSAYGWDPDSRLGLGMPGREGIRAPIQGRVKVDTVGLGVRADNEEDGSGHGPGGVKRRERERRVKESVEGRRGRVGKQKLNAKEVRRGDAETRKKGEKLSEMFYRSEDLGRYLG